ncbi:MAG: hypothetical protein A3B90_01085 [Candidatus Magasanikbacteria bacterium RIFCSPHIGHO2_02_FULL_41_13]|uniref:Endolytic murein transglycosylase n=1 Tax=Candidatus Magasanikbacteria bacterium RIFCSPHIGHO2_02_FULL_41_13 TaxID=1798676 RepID=A0A1F6M4W5_9BACT|nr:MAG: hypothetical protein A3B90_01085 [Candidatus Magasanikbacteria bacterium RIFCSPHIGHO2_02_FULL_41_13]
MFKILKFFFSIFFLIILVTGVFVYRGIHSSLLSDNKITFEIKEGESVASLIQKLKDQKVISSDFLLKQYLKFTGADTKIKAGLFEILPPITLEKIVQALQIEGKNERSITIIPGWDLGDIAKYFEAEGIASSTDFFALTGIPAKYNSATSTFTEQFSILKNKPHVSLEGYLAPETYRIYKNEKIESILSRLIEHRQGEFTTQMLQDIQAQGKSVHEILTLASILEKEVKTSEDRKKVADLFWRRIDAGMGLQADSTVHYLTGREGDVFTKQKEREVDSLYNTYKYRDLPPGPISNPSINSIMAAIYPTANTAVYFLTDSKSEVHYASTLDEHNANVLKYLR